MKPLDLIRTASRLAKSGGSRKPRQSDLKRAISTAYYAMFHALCRNCADCLIGGTNSDRSAPAWRQAYRAVGHGYAKSQCMKNEVIRRFPNEVQDFATLFHSLQAKRHSADYDPGSKFTKSDVTEAIRAADLAIRQFQNAHKRDRRAFAAWTAMKNRPD